MTMDDPTIAPLVPPTPSAMDAPEVVGEPARLRVAEALLWVIAGAHGLGAVGFALLVASWFGTTAQQTIYVGVGPYHGLIAVGFSCLAASLHRRRRWAYLSLPWFFAATLFIQIAFPLVMVLYITAQGGGWDYFYVAWLVLIGSVPFLLYIAVAIIVLMHLYRPGVRVLFGGVNR